MLSSYHDELCFFHIMSLNSYIMLSSYHDEVCWFHIMSMSSYIMLSLCHDELCLIHFMSLNIYIMLSLYIVMSCAFSISCRWVVVLCCQNNIIILCCHHIMTSCASFILCCWVTMLCWMFGTDLTFGTNELDWSTNELPVDKVLFPSQVISLFCYIGLL